MPPQSRYSGAGPAYLEYRIKTQVYEKVALVQPRRAKRASVRPLPSYIKIYPKAQAFERV